MTLPTSGAISLDDIQNEFGGANPISLSEYYDAASGIPASGTISINDFRGKSNILSATFIGSAYANATSVTLPSAPQAGDIILVSAHDYATSPVNLWVSIPAGYTRITRDTRNWHASYATQVDMGYKIATGSEGATISGFYWTATGSLAATVALYRPSSSVSAVTPRDVTTSTGTTSATVSASASTVGSISFLAMTAAAGGSITNGTVMDYAVDTSYGNTKFYAAGLAQVPPASNIRISGMSGGLGFVYAHTYLEIT
jgi:hypothetical protein